MRITIFFFILIIVGCGKKFDSVDDVEPIFSTTPLTERNTFQEETTEFFKLQKLANPSIQNSADLLGFNIMDSIPINLYDVKSLYPKEGFIAVCRKSSKSGRKEILVDRKFWNDNKLNKNLLKALIMHELGHCLLGKAHNDPPGSCRSMMEPRLITVYNSKNFNNQNYFSQDLFKQINPCTPFIPLEKYMISN
jgi:hypothetical protein